MQVAYPARMAKSPAYVGPRFQRRKHWINVLVSENGGPKLVAAAIETPATYITAMCTGARGVGDEIADRLEKKFGKPNGWLDQPIETSSPATQVEFSLDRALTLLGSAIEAAQESEAKLSALTMLAAYIKHPATNADMVPLILKRLSGELSAEVAEPARSKRA